jgi:micrococcal nuclease
MESQMQILIAVVVTTVAVFQTSSFGGALKQSQPLLVRSVIDGDTIDVATVGRVRLLGTDAPGVGRGADPAAPFGREARDRLASLVLSRWVRLEYERAAVGGFNRHQAYVITGDGQFVNAVLVREGLARVSARTQLTRLAELQRAEVEARSARRGLWGSAPPAPLAGYTPDARATRAPAPRSKTHNTRKKKP